MILRTILQAVQARKKPSGPFLLAIDGRAAAGKSSLAAALEKVLDCTVVHMDHFFLRPEQRLASRYLTPGGNIDHERFLTEALIPMECGQGFAYRPFDCGKMALGPALEVPAAPLYVVEGAYACHPLLWKHYDLHVFLTLEKTEQRRRILVRNGPAAAAIFENRWIPLEERYFSAFRIPEHCDLCFQT